MNKYSICRSSGSRPLFPILLGVFSLLGTTFVTYVQAAETEWRCDGPRIIVVTNDPSRMISPASGDFTIAVSFDGTVPANHRPVIQHAINEWNAILQSKGVNPGSYPQTVRYGTPSAANRLAETLVFVSGSGTLQQADVLFDPNRTWFVDATPADDVEFGSNPPAGFDLLSVARHELGHAFGWTESSRVTTLVSSGIFDASRLNIAVVDGGSHANGGEHPNELMQPSIGTRARRGIALYPTAAMVSRAYEYRIPMNFVDPAFGGTPTGSAWTPWRSFQECVNSARSDLPLLLAPTTFTVQASDRFVVPRTISSARGGATITGQ